MSSDAGPGLVTKMPILVEGRQPVRIKPSPGDTARVRLYYGHRARQFSTSDGYSSTLFKPCADRRSTPFPGGIRVTGSDPVTLIVEKTDGTGRWRLPLGTPRHLGQVADPDGG